MTAEIQQPMLSVDDARRLTERIRLTAHSARESIEKLHVLVDQAKAGNAHLALGYQSWTAYLSEVLGEEPLRLARDQRQELVGYLAGEGMSTRAIAPIVGVKQPQVVKDLAEQRQVIPTESPAPDPQEAARQSVARAFSQTDKQPEKPAKVTGLDGKTYTKPAPTAPKTPQRRALPDQFFDASYDLQKVVERIERLAADDRFSQNKEQISAKHRADLLRGIDALQGVVDRLPQPQPKGTNNDQQ
jgi:hypothetical protein